MVDIGLWYIYYSNASVVGSGMKCYNDTEATAGNWSVGLWLTKVYELLGWYIYYSNTSIIGSGTKCYNNTELSSGK